MVRKKNTKQITAIIPTYNEAVRIHNVLNVVTTYPHFYEVIVVDDGSIDHTADVLRSYPTVRYIRHTRNQGKGSAMDTGVHAASGDILFFADADIAGLTHEMITEILTPVMNDIVEMCIGMRNRKLYIANVILAFVPLLGGERALKKSLWMRVPAYYKKRFHIEAALNFYAKHYGNGFSFRVFHGLSQVIKEKKYGIKDGLRQRWELYANVVVAQWKLQFMHVPSSVKAKRLVATLCLESLVGLLVGIFMFVMGVFVPSFVFRQLVVWARYDNAMVLFFQKILHVVHGFGAPAIVLFGMFLISIHAFILFVQLRRWHELSRMNVVALPDTGKGEKDWP